MKLHLILPALLLASPAVAQTTTFTAAIEKADLPPSCIGETHFVSGNGALLGSSTINLDSYLGQPFKFTAMNTASPCGVWDVISAVPASSTLTVCGTPAIGAPLRLRVGPTGVLGEWLLWWSATPLFLPFDPVLGTAMIAPPINLLGVGTTVGAGAFHELTIPFVPSLIGLTIYTQGARRDVGPVGPFELTNPASFTIEPFTAHYVQPSC